MAKREKVQKTNAMRELDHAGIAYEVREFEEPDVSRGVGIRIAEQLGEDPDSSLKTLVCVAPSGEHVVCCIPVAWTSRRPPRRRGRSPSRSCPPRTWRP